ncbi:unnamed protein product [Diamesa serratosioi]
MSNKIQVMNLAVYVAITMSLFGNAQCQLIVKNDAFSNSYSFATPNFQQSFTRYFGGANNANFQQIQPTQQIYTQPQSFNPVRRVIMPSYSNQQQLYAQDLQDLRSSYEKLSTEEPKIELNLKPLYSSNMATNHNIMNVHYSPSNEVSSVKYQSNGLNYNF